ncbi:hypothetical protein F2Q70_00008703 [Brassica cretica]|uniref:Uncharacterized protein n=1 Tax=Brassica cretica TaxID=69181 RepID=A0A8S9MEX3_BRACR|nr:hypothetical protein F2Q68_00001763 [Brassica cretica]KAF2616179.1 hypothetical protein F2Q70_00008703 [Brassica cretica]
MSPVTVFCIFVTSLFTSLFSFFVVGAVDGLCGLVSSTTQKNTGGPVVSSSEVHCGSSAHCILSRDGPFNWSVRSEVCISGIKAPRRNHPRPSSSTSPPILLISASINDTTVSFPCRPGGTVTTTTLSAVPHHTSGTIRSTYPEHRLVRSGSFCISKAPPPLHAASDPFLDAVTPPCCPLTSLDYTAHQCRSGVVSFTTAANLRRSGRGGVSQSCSIAFSSVRIPDPLTTSASNLRLSPTIASFFAGFDNAVFASVIEPTPRQCQGLYGDKLFLVDLLSSPLTTRTCPPHLHLLPHLGSETEKYQFAPPLPCALTPTSRRKNPKYCARRLDRPETFSLLPDVCSNTLNQNECDDNKLRSIPVINYWLRHGNVEVQGFDPIEQFTPSSNSSVLSVTMKAKLAFEIHLVSLRSFVEFKTDPVNFSTKSSHIGLLLGVAQGPRASHQKLLAGNNPVASHWCINVDFDYQLFSRTIALGIRVKLLYGVLHLAEIDSPLIGFIFLCFIMLSTFVLPSSITPESSVSVVNSYVP